MSGIVHLRFIQGVWHAIMNLTRIISYLVCYADSGAAVGKLTVSADAQPHSVVFTAARAATVARSAPRRYAGAMLKPYLPCAVLSSHQ